MRDLIAKTCTIATVGLLFIAGCHRSGTEFTMALLEEELRGLETRTTVDYLTDLFPPYEEWLILPGMSYPDSRHDSLSVWLESYRIVSPDTVRTTDWTRFLRQPDRAEFLSVLGYLEQPRPVFPRGFRGFLVRFRISGVESSALIVDRTTMRFLSWLEQTTATRGDLKSLEDVDGLSSQIMKILMSSKGTEILRGTSLATVNPDLYPSPPPMIIDPLMLFQIAREHAQPSLKGGRNGIVRTPPMEVVERIINQPALPDLELLEPELLQKRLQIMEAAGWPCFSLTGTAIRNLVPGAYIWAEGPYGQLWAMPVESYQLPDEDIPAIGPSALFFGRHIAGAGMFVVNGTSTGIRITEINTYPFEYGLSPYSDLSISIAEHAGEFLFTRMGSLLSLIPGPSEGWRPPVLRTLPEENPALRSWRPRSGINR